MEPAQRTPCTHHPIAAIARSANRQHGVFTRQQALEAGYSTSAISRRRASGVWEAVDSMVYRLAGTPSSWKQRLMAACLAGPAVASHRAAGILWDFPGMAIELVEVTALRHRRRRASDVIWHESFHLSEREVTEIQGIPVTRPIRTFLDLGVVLSANELEEVLDDGRRRKLLEVPAIWRRLDEFGDRRSGAKRARGVLESRIADERPPESVLETRFCQLLRGAGIRLPTSQFEIRMNGGSIARVDFAYPDLHVAIELDGAAYHSSKGAKQRDRTRENRLVALGWRVLRFTWDDVNERPTAVLEDMRCVHGAR